MDENYLNEPRIRRSLILYEFLSGKPIYECFESMCKRIEPDFVIEYREFDFWFQRFASGNFDVDYDISLEPKTRQFTDLPINIFEKITADLEPFNRLVLRKVCKTFRAVVDSWEPKLERIEVRTRRGVAIGNNPDTENDDCLIQEIADGHDQYYDYKLRSEYVKKIEIHIVYNEISLYFNRSCWSYKGTGGSCIVYPLHGIKRFEQEGNYLDVAVDDLFSILCHPNLKLTSFVIDTPYGSDSEATDKFAKKLVQRMETCTPRPKIHAEKVHFSCAGSIEELKILKFFKAGTVKNLNIACSYCNRWDILNEQSIESVTKEIEGLELWETIEEVTFLPSMLQADENFSILRVVRARKMTMKFEKLSVIRFKRISQILLQNNPRLQWCMLEFKVTKKAKIAAKRHLERLGATPSSDLYKFPIANSNDFFSIEFSEVSRYDPFFVLIERKQNVSE